MLWSVNQFLSNFFTKYFILKYYFGWPLFTFTHAKRILLKKQDFFTWVQFLDTLPTCGYVPEPTSFPSVCLKHVPLCFSPLIFLPILPHQQIGQTIVHAQTSCTLKMLQWEETRRVCPTPQVWKQIRFFFPDQLVTSFSKKAKSLPSNFSFLT